MSGKDSLAFVTDKYRADLALPETEDSWERIAKAVIALKSCCDNGTYESPAEVVQTVRSFHAVIKQSLLSERTRLSSAALDLVDSVASACGTDFEALLPHIFPTLMVLTGRTNKVVINRTKACVLHIIDSTPSPMLLPYFLTHLQEKSASMRLISAQCALAYMKCCNPPDLEKESRACDIENLIRRTARDANADVRKVGREIFGAYKILLPHRVDSFTAPLTPTIRKYLDIKSSTNAAAAKPALAKMKSMSALAVAQPERRPESKHVRTASVTVSKSSERVPPAASVDARPNSVAASRPGRVQPLLRTNVAAIRTEPTRRAIGATSTGPSRVLTSSSDAVKLAATRTRVLPSTAPQRTFTRSALPSSSSSGTVTTSGPRRVPLPSPDSGAFVPKRPTSRPVSQQSNVGPGSTTTGSRPTSQQSRPIKAPSKPALPRAGAPPSRAMLPPRTRADGTAIGAPLGVKAPRPAANAVAEPVKRPRPQAGGSMQPTASQLAKVKALVAQKGAVKKPSFKPVPRSAPTTSATVLNKSLKANVPRTGNPTKPATATTESTLPTGVPLPPSPEVLATVPLPEVAPENVPLPEEDEAIKSESAVTTPLPELRVEADPQAVEEVEPCPPLIITGPELVITGSEQPSPELLNTPPNAQLQVDWNVQNAKTPISALLTSIQQGFEFSPVSPLSPPHRYLNTETQPLVLLL